MTLGILMLVHDTPARAVQVARRWSDAGCPVVIHGDAAMPGADHASLVQAAAKMPQVSLSRRHRCAWGRWSIVAATIAAAERMLGEHPQVTHVCLTSGACLPLRPPGELAAFLSRHPKTDFIESVSLSAAPWVKDGLSTERLSLYFPFDWRRHRRLFDATVAFQRRIGVDRVMPGGLSPHLGSQWWCLTRRTLRAILDDLHRDTYTGFFRKTWIPDESFFQTLARRHATLIESRSLTLSRFDATGRPVVFYDDHLDALRASGAFLARKAWPGADALYRAALTPGARARPARADGAWRGMDAPRAPDTARHAITRPCGPGHGRTMARYAVFEGFDDVFDGFGDWLATRADIRVHGHLFAPDRVSFAQGARGAPGALSDSVATRDAAPGAFLASLIRNTRGERQGFLFGPEDRREIADWFADDANATVFAIQGAWLVPLCRSGHAPRALRDRIAAAQRAERAHLARLRDPATGARLRIWTLAEAVARPDSLLQAVLRDLGPPRSATAAIAPALRVPDRFGAFLRNLRDSGLHPEAAGEPDRWPMPTGAPKTDPVEAAP